MTDAFDKQPPPEPEKPKTSIEEWAKKLIPNLENKWLSFIHPIHGRVAAFCEKAAFKGYSEPGRIPEFSLHVVGRSRAQRNEMEIGMVEHYAIFADSEKDAIESCAGSKAIPCPSDLCPACWSQGRAMPLASEIPCSHQGGFQ